MKKLINFRYLFATLCFLALPGLAGAASLLEVYQQALQSDPLIHEAEARRMASLELVPQARGSLFPQISAGGSWYEGTNSNLQQEPEFDNSVPPQITGFTTVDAESDFDGFSWNAELRQTLFRWDQWVGLKQANKRVAKAEVDFEAAQQDLIVRVVTPYSST